MEFLFLSISLIFLCKITEVKFHRAFPVILFIVFLPFFLFYTDYQNLSYVIWSTLLVAALYLISRSETYNANRAYIIHTSGKWVFFAICISIVISIFNGQLLYGQEGRIKGLFAHPNAMAQACLAASAFIFWKSKNINWLYKLLILVLNLILIFLSGSRSSLLSFLLIMIYLLVPFINNVKYNKKLIFYFALMIFFSAGLFVTSQFKLENYLTGTRYENSIENDERVLIYNDGVSQIQRERLFTGVGLNNGIAKDYVNWRGDTIHLHNSFLQILVEAGAVYGAAIILIVVFILSKRIYYYSGDFLILSAFIVNGVVETSLFTPGSIVFPFFWLLVFSYRETK
ncbi:O-antigen ligase family protein [Deinococcus sp. RIT780]|uniref:O-antigen ligase family protein n=1 Tax=Deinococcus sp. RIT780 TaxID=2870472 RepID=UPI001C88FDA4|nr:O-antigen ligase family protein [Deinococcus sp. RIT780]